jgi:hypothetical protein
MAEINTDYLRHLFLLSATSIFNATLDNTALIDSAHDIIV